MVSKKKYIREVTSIRSLELFDRKCKIDWSFLFKKHLAYDVASNIGLSEDEKKCFCEKLN